jgi:hypothetical protein
LRERLRVAINAQLQPDGGTGGIVTVLRALAALARLEDGPEEYVFVGPHDSPEWLRSILPPHPTVVRGPAPVVWGGNYLFTDVWVSRDGAWQVVSRHLSTLTEKR